MRWKAAKYVSPGDIRTVHKFLLIPRLINREWRWFEEVTITQQYKAVDVAMKGGWVKQHRWVNIAWVD